MNITVSPEEARAIVKEAYLYGWPMSENYNTMNAYSINQDNPNYKAPINEIYNNSQVFGPEDDTVVTPNSDTPYSNLWADIRAEPIVITVPPMDSVPAPDGQTRYYSFQLIDLYTYNFDYIGTRTQFEEGGSFMIAGPGWQGADPDGITKVFHCDTEFFFSITRTQLFSPEDQSNVEKLQSMYQVQTLSEFLETPKPTPLAAIDDWPEPCVGEAGKTPAVFTNINFMLQFCPTLPDEEELMQQFAQIGVGPGLPFDASTLSPEMQVAFQDGISDALAEFQELNEQITAGEVSSAEFFGDRATLGDNYLYRFAGAMLGLYGNSIQEAYYQMYQGGLDGSSYAYTLTISEELPYEAFASVTMYDAQTQLLVANEINRYLINTPMLDQLVRNQDDSITLYIQFESPTDPDQQQNWLPAPDGPFYMVMRLYVPTAPVLDGTWVAPKVQKVS